MFLSSILLAVPLFSLSSAAEVINRTGDLHIVNKQAAPDGLTRWSVLAGTNASSASFPGPLIKGNKGDTFSINVVDSLTDISMLTSTSIHWHGIFQEGSNWADGVSFVTQCPITANNSFLYDFKVPDQAGTFWYHSHLSVQYCDGLRGPFVIYDPEDPLAHLYDVDDESTILTLADWYHLSGPEIVQSGQAIVPDATLINGKGRYSDNPTAELAVISVEQGKRYRFRLISMACDPVYNFSFSIDRHNLTVIEADGISHQPATVNSIQIFAAQRYSFVLNATQPVENYWIRALPDAGPVNFTNGVNSAILRYTGAPETDPATSQAEDLVQLVEADLHPLMNPGAPGEPFPGGADLTLNLTLGFNFNTGKFVINDVPFLPPNVPVLLQILSGAQLAQDLLPNGSVYGLPLNKVIEINLNGSTSPFGPHPFHLHGHAFDVVKSFDSDVYNYKDPIRRDVVAVSAGNITSIRFVTDNAGPWFLHCHIDFHLELGLAVVMAEDIKDTNSSNPTPAAWDDLCPLYYGHEPSQF